MEQICISKHCAIERNPRMMRIATSLGWGEVVDKFPQENNRIACVTSTGVVIIKTADERTIITAYFIREYQLIRYYGSVSSIPIHLLSIVRYNERKGIMFSDDDNPKRRKPNNTKRIKKHNT